MLRFLVIVVGVTFVSIGAMNMLYEIRRIVVTGDTVAEVVGGAAIFLATGLAILDAGL